MVFFLADTAAALGRLVGSVGSGRVIAFQEPGDARLHPDALPPCPLLERAWARIVEANHRAGLDEAMSLRLFPLLNEAGLPALRVRLDAAVGSGSDWEGFDYLAETLRAILPPTITHGVVTSEAVGYAYNAAAKGSC